MAFSLASLLTAGLGGYQQGQGQGYSRLAALAQLRLAQQKQAELDAYHQGQVENGQVRNQNAYAANFGDPNNPDVQGKLQIAAKLAQAHSLAITGGVDANGNPVRGSAANADMNANTRQASAFANHQDFFAANPGAALDAPPGVTFNPGLLALAKLKGMDAGAARTQATADKTVAETAQIPQDSHQKRLLQGAQAGMDKAMAGAATGNLAVHQFTAQQQAQVNLRKLQLQKQGLDDTHAYRQAQIEVQRMNAGHGGGVLPNGLTPSQNIALENQAHNNERAAAMLNDSITAGVAGDGKTPLTPGQIATRRHLVQSYQDNNASINRKLSTVAPAAVHPIAGVGGAVRGVLPPGASLGALPGGVSPLPALPHPSATQPRHPVTRQFQARPASKGKLDFSKFRP